jgi:hypothetical protein
MEFYYIDSSEDLQKMGLAGCKKFIRKTYPPDTSLIICVEKSMPPKIKVYEKGETRLVFGGSSVKLDLDDLPTSTTEPAASRYDLPPLYKLDKKKKERVWRVWVIGPTVYKTYGEEGGKLIPVKRTFEGVNTGKKNETTAEEQAKREAERKWVKQFDKEYLPKCKEGKAFAKRILDAKKSQGNVNVGVSNVIRGTAAKSQTETAKKARAKKASTKIDDGTLPGYETPKGGVLPMHCQPWSEEQKVLKYFGLSRRDTDSKGLSRRDTDSKGLSSKKSNDEISESFSYAQPKLDGIRCFVKIVDGHVVLLTRNGKQLVHLQHLREQALLFLEDEEDTVLDCEVYTPTIYGKAVYAKSKVEYIEGDEELPKKQRFEVISGAVRPVRSNPHPLENQMCLYVFDVADQTGKIPQTQRFKKLDALFSRPQAKKTPNIQRVKTKKIRYLEDIDPLHDAFVEEGYEGLVIRARDLLYESNKRSLKMRKYKKFFDTEYPIEGIKSDKGVGCEQFTWVCSTIVEGDDGKKVKKTFNVKPEGSVEQKKVWFENSKDYIGKKMLTVKYQELSSDGVPRFPIGIAIRDYE